MKKRNDPVLKRTFKAAAAAMAIVTGENHVSAMESAGVFYDNVRSGLTLHNLRESFARKIFFAPESDENYSAHRPERTPKIRSAPKQEHKFRRHIGRRDI